MHLSYKGLVARGAAAASATLSSAIAIPQARASAARTGSAAASTISAAAPPASAATPAAATALRANSTATATSVKAAAAVSATACEESPTASTMAVPAHRARLFLSFSAGDPRSFVLWCGASGSNYPLLATACNTLYRRHRAVSARPSLGQEQLLLHVPSSFRRWPAAECTAAATRTAPQAAARSRTSQLGACSSSSHGWVSSSSDFRWDSRCFSSSSSSAGAATGNSSSGSSSDSHRHHSGAGSSWSSSHRSSSGRGSPFGRQQKREGCSSGGSSSSFIRSVLQQVKTDMQENEELQKAMKELKASQLTQKSMNVGQRVQNAATAAAAAAKKILGSTQQVLSTAAERAASVQQQIQEKTQQASEKHPAFREVQGAVGRASKNLRTAASKIEAFASSLFRDDENDAEKKAAQWQQQMAIRRYKQQQREKQRQQQQQQMQQQTDSSCVSDASAGSASSHAAGAAAGQQQSHQQQQTRHQAAAEDEKEDGEEQQRVESALVVSQRTTWDRFGSRLREMPFLQSFLDNPLVSQLFGETEIAASIREMKTLDPKFKLADLHNLVERVVASHVVQAFLLGDEETLALHCGEGAFAALRASIVERRVQRVRLDSEILQLSNVDLVGARRCVSPPSSSSSSICSAEEVPWFIYTFNCQQINCLRSEVDGRVVEGSPDDIRRVLYSIAIARHPKPETEGLLYPWVIQEIAIVGSEAVW